MLLASVLASTATAFAVSYFVVPPPPSSAPPPPADTGALGQRIAELENRVQSLRDEAAGSLQGGATRREVATLDDAAIERAVHAWLERNRGSGELATRLAEADASKPIETAFDPAATLEALWKLDWETQSQRWSALSKEQRDALVTHLEDLAKANPSDANTQVRLGEAYVQKILAPGTGFMEMAKYGQAADRQFTKALELDDHHWDARFNKAMGLAHQPAVLGGRPKAIEHLEILMAQQEQLSPETRHSGVYLILGNLWAEQGNQEKAREIWERGSRRHPSARDLAERLKN
ncbi:MAG: hypothetical protein R3F56_04285 [Planctomycetota bacterium]